MEETIYSVSQTVKFLEVQSHVLRYWEEEMKLPIGRNEMGHRYYTRRDIQVFLSIKELKKKGYSLKEIGELTSLFYQKQEENSEKKEQNHEVINKQKQSSGIEKTEKKQNKQQLEKTKQIQKTSLRQKEKLPKEFMDIISRLVKQRLPKKDLGEEKYKRLDERIRSFQQSRREAAAAEEKNTKKKGIFKKA